MRCITNFQIINFNIAISPRGQLNYLNKLKEVIKKSGGKGLIYWEPAWVSTNCGSHWENAILFDFDKKANLGMKFYNASLHNTK